MTNARKPRKPQIKIHKVPNGGYGWTLVSVNGTEIAQSVRHWPYPARARQMAESARRAMRSKVDILALAARMGTHHYRSPMSRTDHRKRWLSHIDAADLIANDYLESVDAGQGRRWALTDRARRDLEHARSQQVSA